MNQSMAKRGGRLRLRWAVLALAAACWAPGLAGLGSAGAQRASDDEAVRASAGYLLRRAVSAERGPAEDQLLRALRQLREPSLRPLFEALSRRAEPGLRIHGVLGAAELSDPPGVDLSAVAEVADPAAQAELVSAALDGELLTLDQAEAVLGWSDAEPGLKLLLAARLLGADRPVEAGWVREAAQTDRLGPRALAGLILTELGDPKGPELLAALDASDDPQRDAVRAMLLETALRHEFSSAGAWVLGVSREPEAHPTLSLVALRAAMRFGQPGAVRDWASRFAAATDPAQRLRLAHLALHLSPWLEPGLFGAMEADESELIAAMGAAGRAVASGSPDLADRVVEMVLHHHPVTSQWALRYARSEAGELDAAIILLALVDGGQQGPEATRGGRLALAAEAAEAMIRLEDQEMAANLLLPILADPDTAPRLQAAILVGLARTPPAMTRPVVERLPAVTDPDAQDLSVVLRARIGMALSQRETRRLGRIVRGGTDLDPAMRLQAAWAYLTQRSAFAEVRDAAIGGR